MSGRWTWSSWIVEKNWNWIQCNVGMFCNLGDTLGTDRGVDEAAIMHTYFMVIHLWRICKKRKWRKNKNDSYYCCSLAFKYINITISIIYFMLFILFDKKNNLFYSQHRRNSKIHWSLGQNARSVWRWRGSSIGWWCWQKVCTKESWSCCSSSGFMHEISRKPQIAEKHA